MAKRKRQFKQTLNNMNEFIPKWKMNDVVKKKKLPTILRDSKSVLFIWYIFIFTV